MARDRSSRPGAEPLRLFAAVVPPRETVEAVLAAVAPWRERLEGGRWERPEKMHFTLKFMGRVWPRLVGSVEDACRAVAAGADPFDVRLGGLGVFPSPGRARVLWAGVAEGGKGLSGLATSLDEALAGGFPAEARAFTPHLTVARFRGGASVKAEIEGLRATEIAAAFRVERLTLVRSHLQGPKGSRYEVLAEEPLGG